MDDGWLSELAWSHSWQEGPSDSLVHGHVRSRALHWAKHGVSPMHANDPCVCVCAR